MNGDLSGVHVLLTRQCNQALRRQIVKHGGSASSLPLFSIQPLLDQRLLATIKTKYEQANLIICISPNAAQIVVPKLHPNPNTTWATPGPHTAKILLQHGIKQVLFPVTKPYDSAGLVQVLQKTHRIQKAVYNGTNWRAWRYLVAHALARSWCIR